MRVLIPLDNPGGGGIARVGRDLAAALSRALPDTDQLLIAGSLAGMQPRGNVRQAPRVGTSRGRVARVLSDQLTVGRAARHVDLVHMPDAKAPLLSRRPFVLTLHDLFFLDYPKWFPPAVGQYKRRLLTLSLQRGPTAIVCVSEHTARRLAAHHPAACARYPVEVIHPGVHCPPAAGRQHSGGDEEPYFLTVSAIEPRKNHLGLLSAFQAARREGLNLRWKVVGAPQYAGEPIIQALSGAEGVELLGRVEQDELERLYRGATFVATPSFAEGFGFPPLEAMARGVPVICASGSALDETVGEAALRIAPEDEIGWARALRELATNAGLRQRLIVAGEANARRFSWDGAARAHLDLFARALAGQKR
ncbi:MAG: glycosyltransferase family 1 protein [Solirubrobacteraceae bacterium]